MEIEYLTARKTVCQDFRILMRTEIEIPIPVAYPVIRDFYRKLIDTVLRWTVEREGERLRGEYLAKEIRERARYRTKLLQVRGEVLPTADAWFALVCHAKETGAETWSVLQVWNLSEQTLLPSKEIISRFRNNDFAKYLTNFYEIGKKRKKHLKKKKEYDIIKQ